MKIRYLTSRIAGVILGLTLLFGIGVGTSTNGHAQDRNRSDDQDRRDGWDGYRNYGGSFELRQTALNAGYNEGIKDGRNNRQKGGRTDFRDQRTYQLATKDYSARLGDRELYRRYFREAYEKGYNAEGQAQVGNGDQNRRGRNRGRNWDGYRNYGGSFELRQTALNAGYNEGIKEGRKDRNKGNRSDYHNNSAYQKATSDYSSKLGDRELYRRYYREAYENGYDAGINGY